MARPPTELGLRVYPSTPKPPPRAMAQFTHTIQRACERAVYVFRRISWNTYNKPPTDIERLGFRLALMHIREDRPELAEEDLLWLAKRIRERRV